MAQMIRTNQRKEECGLDCHQIHFIHMNGYIHVVFFQENIPDGVIVTSASLIDNKGNVSNIMEKMIKQFINCYTYDKKNNMIVFKVGIDKNYVIKM
jgi:hypothetical protein